jgi:hypothetical protein
MKTRPKRTQAIVPILWNMVHHPCRNFAANDRCYLRHASIKHIYLRSYWDLQFQI